MTKTQEIAIKNFNSGFNCAQAVLTPYIEKLNLSNETALFLACGFGGGMGRLQETCGAVTGAFMVLGAYNCRKYSDYPERKDKTAEMVRAFYEKFNNIYKTTSCRQLLNADLLTEEGRKFVKDNDLHNMVCGKCIQSSIEILDDMMKD